MKVSLKNSTPDFEPVELSVRFETSSDLAGFMRLFGNMSAADARRHFDYGDLSSITLPIYDSKTARLVAESLPQAFWDALKPVVKSAL